MEIGGKLKGLSLYVYMFFLGGGLHIGGLWYGCRVYVDISSVRQAGFGKSRQGSSHGTGPGVPMAFLGLLCNTVGMEGGRVGYGMDGADMR